MLNKGQLEEFDAEQAELDKHAEKLRAQIPKEGEETADAKSFGSQDKKMVKDTLYQWRHPAPRKPEKGNPFEPKPQEIVGAERKVEPQRVSRVITKELISEGEGEEK